MDLTLCGTSAFRFHRTPPQVLAFYPPLKTDHPDANHRVIANSPTSTELLRLPLQRLVFDQNHRHNSNLYNTRLIAHELPHGSIQETDFGFSVTSPAATLLTMAGHVSRIHLLMAAYELCGSFTVFNPCKRVELDLEAAYEQGFLRPGEGWRRVENVDGMGTSLWSRQPALTPEGLVQFCEQASGLQGIKDLRWVASNLTGVTASPFEAQTSMLLGLPRRLGGEGLELKNNQRIQLSPAARTIYPYNSCYADILIEGNGDNAGVIIECQGRSVHAGEAAAISDSDRTTALISMGYEVILLTYDQITSPRSFQTVLDIIATKTATAIRPKTERQLRAQSDLRSEIFIDWNTLGQELSASKKKNTKLGSRMLE